MKDKLYIKLNIADRFYPMMIDPIEEEKILKASKIINGRILLYKKQYNGKDDQDFLAMMVVQFTIQLLELLKEKDIDPFIEELEAVEKELKKYLDLEKE